MKFLKVKRNCHHKNFRMDFDILHCPDCYKTFYNPDWLRKKKHKKDCRCRLCTWLRGYKIRKAQQIAEQQRTCTHEMMCKKCEWLATPRGGE